MAVAGLPQTLAPVEPDVRITLTDEWTKRQAAHEVDGSYWSPDVGAWVVDDPTPRAAAIAMALFPELVAEYPELIDIRDEGYAAARPTDYATDLDLKVSWLGGDGRTLFPFQETDTAYIKAIIERDHGGFIGWSRGLGKTTAAAAIIDLMGYRRTIVVASNTAKASVWQAELAEMLPNHLVLVLPNDKAKREALVAGWKKRTFTKPVILIVHYESLALIAGKKGKADGWKKMGQFDATIFDEAHRLATMRPNSPRNTQLGRAAMKMRAQATDALVLTGSGIMNKEDDLFGPIHFIFPERYASVWKDWNDRFVDFVNPYGRKVPIGWKPEALERLRDELGVFMVYRTKEDELDLPAIKVERELIPLGAKQREAYDDVAAQFWSVLENDVMLKAVNKISQLNLLRRIATGLDDQGVADSSKIDRAIQIIKEHPDEAFVVFSWYKAPLHALAEKLRRAGEEFYLVDGDVPQRERPPAIEAFMAGHGRVFLGTLSTLGESVNLQRASRAIFLDRAWNPATNDQAADRIYRIGTTRPVTITHLIAEDTVDELRVLPVLAAKAALRRAVFGA